MDSYQDSLAAVIDSLAAGIAAHGDNFIPQKREITADLNKLSSVEVAALCDNFIRHVDHFLGSQEKARIFSQRNAPDTVAAFSRCNDILGKVIKKCREGTFHSDKVAALRECLGKDVQPTLGFGKKLVQLVGPILTEALWLLDNGPALAETLQRRGFNSSGVLRVVHRASESGYGSPAILPKWERIKVALQRAAIQLRSSEPTGNTDPTPPATKPKPAEGNGGPGSTPLTSDANGETMDSVRDKVFISYSHKDRRWLDDLLIHLKPYLRDGSVTAWSDQQIAPGSKWFAEIKAAIAATKVAVLLVTSDFLASEFIHEHELGPFLKEAEVGGVRIIWIPIRACSYEKTPLKPTQAVIDPAKPLAGVAKASRDLLWVQICKEIENAVSR